MRPAILGSILLAMVCASCNTHSKEPLIPDAMSQVTDVPVPAGFVLSGNSSSKYVPASQLRFVDYRYTGHDVLPAVISFYKEQLPAKNWKLVEQTQPTADEVVLHYNKGKEDAVLTVTNRPWQLDTMIHIRIDPQARNATP
jgi:hypothetical protein